MRRNSEATGATLLGKDVFENREGQAYDIVEGVVSGLTSFVSTAVPPPVDVLPSLLKPPCTSAHPALSDDRKLVQVTTLRSLKVNERDLLTAFKEESRRPMAHEYHFRKVLETLCRRSAYVEDKRWIFRDWLDYSIEVLLLLCGKSQEWLQQLRPPLQQSLALSARLEAELRDPHWELLYLLSLRETDIDLYQHLLSTWFETSVENAVEEDPVEVRTGRSDDTLTWMVETLVEHVAELPVVAVESVMKKSGFISQLDPTSGGAYLGLQRRESFAVVLLLSWDSLGLCVEQEGRLPYMRYEPLGHDSVRAVDC